jgi:hypothetical protein
MASVVSEFINNVPLFGILQFRVTDEIITANLDKVTNY